MKRLLTFALFTVAFNSLVSQTVPPFSSDNPDQGISHLTPGHHNLYVESGAEFGQTIGSDGETSFQNLTTILRYGIGRAMEVNLLTQVGWENQSQPGLRDPQPGFRLNIFEEPSGIRPALAVQASVKVPSNLQKLGLPYFVPDIFLVAHYQLPGELALNFGNKVYLAHNQWAFNWRHLANVSFPFSRRLRCFVEYYGDLNSLGYQAYLDTGLSMQVNDNFQCQLWANGGYNQDVLLYSALVSFSVRVLSGR